MKKITTVLALLTALSMPAAAETFNVRVNVGPTQTYQWQHYNTSFIARHPMSVRYLPLGDALSTTVIPIGSTVQITKKSGMWCYAPKYNGWIVCP